MGLIFWAKALGRFEKDNPPVTLNILHILIKKK